MALLIRGIGHRIYMKLYPARRGVTLKSFPDTLPASIDELQAGRLSGYAIIMEPLGAQNPQSQTIPCVEMCKVRRRGSARK